MKKLLVSTLAAFVLLATGTAFAQVVSGNHQLRVTIPEVVMIQIVTSDTATAFVEFDYAALANQPTYFGALAVGGGTLPPTDGNIADIRVLAIGTTWQVNVSATAFTPLFGVGLDDIRVTPALAFGAPFTLAAGTNAMGGGPTNWTSLGINWQSYALTVNGDEDADDQTILVTYTIVDL